MLLYILMNALEAAEAAAEKWIKISVRPQNDVVQVLIEDSGAGVPENIRSKIFQPFFTTKAIGGKLWLGAQAPTTRFILQIPTTQEGISPVSIQ